MQCYRCILDRQSWSDVMTFDNLPHPVAEVTEVIAKKLMKFRLADVPNLSKLIASYLDPADYVIRYNSDIPNIKDILHDSDTYSSGRFINHSGILKIDLEYKCNCWFMSSSINILPRGTYIGRIYFDMEGNIVIDTFKSIILPKNRIAVMASTNGVICVPAKVLQTKWWK